jgi:hypothetical protein
VDKVQVAVVRSGNKYGLFSLLSTAMVMEGFFMVIV